MSPGFLSENVRNLLRSFNFRCGLNHGEKPGQPMVVIAMISYFANNIVVIDLQRYPNQQAGIGFRIVYGFAFFIRQ